MNTMTSAREVAFRHFENIKDVDEEVIRGEKRHGDRCYAVAFVDFADDIVGRANGLEEFQERVMGDYFFSAPEQLRWNNYLYLVAGPKSLAQVGFAAAKARIEADKEYARKRVVSAGELEGFFSSSKLFNPENLIASRDVVADWSTQLAKGQIDSLLDKPTPRTDVIERIGRKAASRSKAPARPKALHAIDEKLSKSHLRTLEIEKFRSIHNGKSYSFGAVTLIVGSNGAGKTSLLEAIEHLYCGFNRRAVEDGMSVKGTCRHLETKETFSIASTSDSSRIKARCFAWYRREERLAKQIVEGFTRYNFLDTDAAFRISTDLEPGDITKDLSKLLIGAEASTIWEYLSKIAADLDTAWTKADDRLSATREKIPGLEAELTRLKELPSLGNTLTASYRAAVAALGWYRAEEVTDLATDHERLMLNKAMQHLAFLYSSSAPGAGTRRGIETRIADVKAGLAKASEAKLQILTADEKVKRAHIESDKLAGQIKLLNQWIPYCSSGFSSALSARIAAQSFVDESRSLLGKLINLPDFAIPNAHASASLRRALSEAEAEMTVIHSNLTALEERSRGFGHLEAARSLAAQQLKDAAILVLKYSESGHKCPVCSTPHDADLLLSKIDAITSMGAISDELRVINEALEQSRSSHSAVENWIQVLASMREVAQVLLLHEDVKIMEVVSFFDSARSRANAAVLELAKAEEVMSNHAKSGMSEREYETIRNQVTGLFDIGLDSESAAVSVTLRDSKEERRKAIETELGEFVGQIADASERIGLVVSELDTSDWPQAASQNRDFQSLSNMERDATQLMEHVNGLAELFPVADETGFAELRRSILGIVSAFDAAVHAVTTEAGASEAIVLATQNIEAARSQVKALTVLTENQKAALDVLRLLFKESSLEAATEEALGSIGSQISEVFGRIHAPSEYEYCGDGNQLLRTRENHESRTLNQISTGQRAAFALSIFLALNLTVPSAPPLLLLDDPIAHIDDLNALSFMDYLRDLAVRSRRQIFFATADSRIAALFEKKFSFMGEEFRTIRFERRTEI